MNKEKKGSSGLRHNILSVVGIALCVILIPILIINCTLLIKGWTNTEEVPTIANICPMIVMTPSMEGEADDCFNAGDLIFIKLSKPEEVSVGDVITFYDPDGSGTSVLSHRVVEIYEEDGKKFFRTKGDANIVKDPTPAPAENLIGKYTGVRIPFAGRVAMFMQTTWGFVVCVFLPIVILVGYDYLRRAKYNKKHESDKDELMAELEELRRMKAEQEANALKETVGESTPPPADGNSNE